MALSMVKLKYSIYYIQNLERDLTLMNKIHLDNKNRRLMLPV